MSFFQALLTAGEGTNPGGGFDYYVSTSGTGDGRTPVSPMSYASFLSLAQSEFDRVFFLRDDEF